jgi:EAL domain-containing protein (putative c-di-GMP-specific phosphodiesterase class I)
LKKAKKVRVSDYQFFSKELTQNAMKRLELENNLRTIVNEKKFDKQFEVYYQPIVEKGNNGSYQIIGCEALLRWNNPDLGKVSPAVFIPIAEETDLICPIGDWVLYKAINDFKSMAEKVSHPLYISVNFSAKQMKSPDILSKIEGIIANTHIHPSNLHLEITETSLLDEEIQVLENISALEKLGLRIAIDDFGIGFASLKYLQKFPVSIIKIDRSFIQHINLSLEHKKLVESIIILGKNLNKDIIAEGVENVQHLQVLNTQNCHKFQGFLFSKPLQLKEFEHLLKGKHPFADIVKLPSNKVKTASLKN